MDKNQRLFDHVADFIKVAFEENGEVQPMWLLEDEKGMIQPVVTPFDGSESKDECARFIKLAIKSHKAVRLGFMAEAWALFLDKNHPDFGSARKIQPSDHPDRREVIQAIVEDKNGTTIVGHYFILRPEIGKPTLSPFKQEKGYDKSSGRFTGLFKE